MPQAVPLGVAHGYRAWHLVLMGACCAFDTPAGAQEKIGLQLVRGQHVACQVCQIYLSRSAWQDCSAALSVELWRFPCAQRA